MTVSDAVGANIRDFRKRRGWKPADLARRCSQLGGGAEAITASVVENIEHGRRRDGERTRDITVDELVALAHALSVPPAALLPELGEGAGDMRVMFGLEDAEAGLRATLARVEEIKTRIAADKERGEKTIFLDPDTSPFHMPPPGSGATGQPVRGRKQNEDGTWELT